MILLFKLVDGGGGGSRVTLPNIFYQKYMKPEDVRNLTNNFYIYRYSYLHIFINYKMVI